VACAGRRPRAFLKRYCATQPAAGNRCAGREAGVRGQALRRRSFRQDGQLVDARAKGEVILSAGAVGSPQILAAFRRRPGDWLLKHGIAPVLDKPGVGPQPADHLQQRAIYKVSASGR